MLAGGAGEENARALRAGTLSIMEKDAGPAEASSGAVTQPQPGEQRDWWQDMGRDPFLLLVQLTMMAPRPHNTDPPGRACVETIKVGLLTCQPAWQVRFSLDAPASVINVMASNPTHFPLTNCGQQTGAYLQQDLTLWPFAMAAASAETFMAIPTP